MRALRLLAVLASVAAQAMALEVPVSVTEPAGLDRPGECISGGICLPAGAFRREATFALFDGDRPVPVQVSPLVTGADGSLRWILLDYQLDLKAGEKRILTLRDRTPARPQRPLRIADNADGIAVDTGAIAFRIPRDKPFALVQEVTAGGKPALTGSAVRYTDALTGRTCSAAAPRTLQLVYAGPLRVTIEARGSFADDAEAKLRYATYITAWAGRSDILVKHILINSREDRRYHTQVGASTIELKPAAPGRAFIGLDKPVEIPAGKAIDLHQGLLPTVAGAVRLTGADAAWSGKAAAGWIASGGIFIADRLFSTDPPRRLSIRADGTLVLDASPKRFDGVKEGDRVRGQPFEGEHRWLFDCSQHSSEYRIDFAAPADPAALQAASVTAAARVWGFAPGSWYSACDVLAVGRFGTLEDEKACHERWGWAARSEPAMKPNPTRFVAWEDNHYESEADSAEGLLLMFLRTGQRGWLDEAEAWCRYHTDLQTWRTDGWAWKDGAIWFPTGGPLGNKPQRPGADSRGFRTGWDKQATARDRDLWRICIAKECYCHYYGAGLADFYCLTGDRDALDALLDKCEMKLDEFTRSRQFTPGKSGIACTRGFGRGFYVAARAAMIRPEDPMLRQLLALCRETLVKLPDTYMDERCVYAPVQNSEPGKSYLTDGIRRYMADNGITVDKKGTFRDRSGNAWQWRDIGGTWMISYIDYAAEMMARQTGDEDLADYVIASGQFTAKHMQSPVAKQTWYYTALDIPVRGAIWDGWRYDGQARNPDGEGPKESGWYTRFFPDVCAQAWALCGEEHLLAAARDFWSYGNRREYQSTKLNQQHAFAMHRPPKDDSILSTARLFYLASHPRADTKAPAAITDLQVTALGDGRFRVTFTAPTDAGGKVARYQVKADALPILPYEKWDVLADSGKRRNWWRAVNCMGEPTPGAPGQREEFTVTCPAATPRYFAVRSYDEASNMSGISNVAAVRDLSP